jgi:hypothetical protein
MPEGDNRAIERAREKAEAERPLRESGEGESEGFEEAEAELIEHASHGRQGPDPTLLAGRSEPDHPDVEYGEADHEDKHDD